MDDGLGSSLRPLGVVKCRSSGIPFHPLSGLKRVGVTHSVPIRDLRVPVGA